MDGNNLAWAVYQRVRLCRHGDQISQLDYSTLFRLMDLESFEPDSQREVYEKIYLVEAELLRKRSEELKRAAENKNGQPSTHNRRK